MFKILIAEDDRALRALLAQELRDEGYLVCEAANGAKALAAFGEFSPDLVLLDVDMPVLDGIEACRKLRAIDPMVPILFLSGFETPEMHIKGMKAGADDYMDKTMESEERRLRIHRALVRAKKCSPDLSFAFGSATVDPEAFTIAQESGAVQPLTTREVEVLRYLAMNSGKVITWDSFQTRFWGIDDEGAPDKLRQAICRLRDKLGRSADCLKTIKGVGIKYEMA